MLTAGYQKKLDVLLKRDWRMLIGGELLAASSGETMTTSSPYDGRVLAEVPLAAEADVERALEAAQCAFESWRATPLTERIALIRRFAQRLQQRAEEFGILDAADVGNPVTAMIGDVRMAAQWLEYHASVAFEVKGTLCLQ